MQANLDWLKTQSLDFIQAVAVFNFQPINYAHPQHYNFMLDDQIAATLRESLLNTKRLSAHWSKQILLQNGLHGDYYFDFNNTADRIGLAAANDIKRVADTLGLVANFQASAAFINKVDVKRVRHYWGNDIYQLAFRLQGQLGCEDSSTSLMPSSVDELIKRVERDGLSILVAWAASRPAAFNKRLLLKMPPQTGYISNNWIETHTQLADNIIKELLPTWLHISSTSNPREQQHNE